MMLSSIYKVRQRKNGSKWIRVFNYEKQLMNSTLYSFVEDGFMHLNIHRINLNSNPKINTKDKTFISFGNKLRIMNCPNENTAYIVNEQELVKYILRYYKFLSPNP